MIVLADKAYDAEYLSGGGSATGETRALAGCADTRYCVPEAARELGRSRASYARSERNLGGRIDLRAADTNYLSRFCSPVLTIPLNCTGRPEDRLKL